MTALAPGRAGRSESAGGVGGAGETCGYATGVERAVRDGAKAR